MSQKILCVDDDPSVLAGYQRNLRKQFAIETAAGGQEALGMLKENGPYAVIVSDMQMPVMDGIQFLQNARVICPDTVRIMLTGNADQLTVARAVNEGHVFQFLTKPCSSEELGKVIEAGLAQHSLITVEHELLDKTLKGVVKMLVEILSTLDAESYSHSRTLKEYVSGFVESAKISDGWVIETAAMLCPIGCITIPPTVLRKARANQPLNGEEKDMLARIPRVGSEFVGSIPRLEEVGRIILYQDKRFDGSGYPTDPILGEEIPFGARLIKVFYDLIRFEASGMSRSQAINRMQQHSPGVYDPSVLRPAFAYLLTCEAARPAQEECVVIEVSIRDLQVGVLLASDVTAPDGTVFVTAGTAVTPMLFERLKNFARMLAAEENIDLTLKCRLAKAQNPAESPATAPAFIEA